MMKLLSQLDKADLEGKKVLVRVDFNVAVQNEKITEPFKIEEAKPTIEYLLDADAKVTLASHITSVPSFDPIRGQIAEILGDGFELLENVRKNEGEKSNDAAYAQELANGHDLYVNDAFAVCHRNHASVVAVTKYLPSYAGFLVEREIRELEKAVNSPAESKVVVLGGAKIDTKLPVIKNFLNKSHFILVGGALMNKHDELEKMQDEKIILPIDSKPGTGNALDIGPETITKYTEIIRSAQFVVWNGPMGKYEEKEYSTGTREIALAVASTPHSVIGGGDTVAAVRALVPEAKFSYVSTGGGAMLEFLANKRLPALEALDYYAN